MHVDKISRKPDNFQWAKGLSGEAFPASCRSLAHVYIQSALLLSLIPLQCSPPACRRCSREWQKQSRCVIAIWVPFRCKFLRFAQGREGPASRGCPAVSGETGGGRVCHPRDSVRTVIGANRPQENRLGYTLCSRDQGSILLWWLGLYLF